MTEASISGGATPEDIGEFGDNHDLSGYVDQAKDVTDQLEFEIQSVRHLVALGPHVLREAMEPAREQGNTVHTLVTPVRETPTRLSAR